MADVLTFAWRPTLQYRRYNGVIKQDGAGNFLSNLMGRERPGKAKFVAVRTCYVEVTFAPFRVSKR